MRTEDIELDQKPIGNNLRRGAPARIKEGEKQEQLPVVAAVARLQGVQEFEAYCQHHAAVDLGSSQATCSMQSMSTQSACATAPATKDRSANCTIRRAIPWLSS